MKSPSMKSNVWGFGGKKLNQPNMAQNFNMITLTFSCLKHGQGRVMAKDLIAVEKRSLTAAQYGGLADVPPRVHCP